MLRSFKGRLAGKAGKGYNRTPSCCTNAKGPSPVPGQKTVQNDPGNKPKRPMS